MRVFDFNPLDPMQRELVRVVARLQQRLNTLEDELVEHLNNTTYEDDPTGICSLTRGRYDIPQWLVDAMKELAP